MDSVVNIPQDIVPLPNTLKSNRDSECPSQLERIARDDAKKKSVILDSQKKITEESFRTEELMGRTFDHPNLTTVKNNAKLMDQKTQKEPMTSKKTKIFNNNPSADENASSHIDMRRLRGGNDGYQIGLEDLSAELADKIMGNSHTAIRV